MEPTQPQTDLLLWDNLPSDSKSEMDDSEGQTYNNHKLSSAHTSVPQIPPNSPNNKLTRSVELIPIAIPHKNAANGQALYSVTQVPHSFLNNAVKALFTGSSQLVSSESDSLTTNEASSFHSKRKRLSLNRQDWQLTSLPSGQLDDSSFKYDKTSKKNSDQKVHSGAYFQNSLQFPSFNKQQSLPANFVFGVSDGPAPEENMET